MSRPDGPVRQPGPDLDQVLGAVVALVEAMTYADAVRRVDEVAMTSFRGRPAGAAGFRDDANRSQEEAAHALYELLDHERVMRLIPVVGGRGQVARRAEDAYAELAAPRAMESGQVSDDADGVS